MYRRIRLKSWLAILAVLSVGTFYTFVDFRSVIQIKERSSSRRLAHISVEDIRKVTTNVTDNLSLQDSNSEATQKNSLPNDFEGALRDRKGLNSVRSKNGKTVEKFEIIDDTVDNFQEAQRRIINKLAEIANNETLFPRAKDGLNIAPFKSPIPPDKRLRLESFLSHLDDRQFNEVYRSVMGRDHLAQNQNLQEKKREAQREVAEESTKISAIDKAIQNKNENSKTNRQIKGSRGYASRVMIEQRTLPANWQTPTEVIERLEHRKKHVKEVCQKYNLDVTNRTYDVNAWEFLINKEHKMIWCAVFKAASSTWFYNFNVLVGYPENKLLTSKDTPVSLARRKYPRPTKEKLIMTANQTDDKYLSFIVVRHPFTRLVSGYRDKLMGGRRYYSSLAQQIVKSYPHLGKKGGPSYVPFDSVSNSLRASPKKIRVARKMVVPTFPQFVQYIIDNAKKGAVLDEHWAPVHKFCTPCLFQFDIIAKTETLDEDGNYIIFESGIQDIIKPKLINRNKNASTTSVMESFICQLSTDMLKNLIEIYKYDLELFEYEYNNYLNCTTDTPRPT